MKEKRKLKKIQKSTKDAQKSLLNLLKKGGSKKKKINEKISEIQDLAKTEKNLLKDIKRIFKKKKALSTKTETKPLDIANDVPKKKVKADMKGTNYDLSTEQIVTELSKDINAKEAIKLIGKMTEIDEVKEFVQGENRPTVVARSQSKINALTK